MTFALTTKQQEAKSLLSSDAKYAMLFGGSRSGKTFILCYAIAVRAIAAPGSRHAILRFRSNAAKRSIALDTFPKMMRLCFPGVPLKWNDQMGYFSVGMGSEVWVGGLDDADRAEKILGLEFATAFLNECSQIQWGTVGTVVTRLAQVVYTDIDGQEPKPLKRRMYFDCNPPTKAHWTYKVFIQKKDPESGIALHDQENYCSMRINPVDNRANVGDYIETLHGLSSRLRRRFLDGEFSDATPNQLFPEEWIDRYRIEQDENGHSLELPDFARVVIGVDPSGSGDEDNADNDAIGIVVGALGVDGNAYLLEDCTVKAGPATWGNIATSAYERHSGDLVVGEVNYGGAMVGQVIKAARPLTPFKAVTASRGKVVRAEPYSGLYEKGKVRHVGRWNELEDELAAFSTIGYTGPRSPNRADAWIWVLAELFPGIARAPKVEEKAAPEPQPSEHGWMA